VSLYVPAGSAGSGRYSAVVTPESAGWTYSGLRILELAAGGRISLDTGGAEMAVLSLAGSCTVEAEGKQYDVAGRESVFSGVSDFVYLPRETDAVVESPSESVTVKLTL